MTYLKDTLKDITLGSISLDNSKIVEPSAGNGSFYDAIEHREKVAYDTNPYEPFADCIEYDFLKVNRVPTDRKYRIFLGFPPTRNYVEFITHSFELKADVIGFILPISSTNKKNMKIYNDKEYTVVFNKPIISDNFTLPDGSSWDMNGNFVIIIKDEHIKKAKMVNTGKTYKDFFDVYTINQSIMTIKETSQPNLFKDGKVPKNRRTGKPYEILTDENGYKFYYQNGINIDMIDQCQLFVPLRVFPSKEEGIILYDTFDDSTFAKIGFGLKVKEGYSVRKVKGKIIYYIY